MKVLVASDHAGFTYKGLLIPDLIALGYDPVDLGAFDTSPVDYPDYAAAMAVALTSNEATKGIIICGSGAGVCIAANKFRGIRAATCHDSYSAHQCVEHDNANVLCIGERIVGVALMKELCLTFLKAAFSGEQRHVRRLEKITLIENQNFR